MRTGMDLHGVLCPDWDSQPSKRGLRYLAEHKDVVIISRAGRTTEARSRAWLQEYNIDVPTYFVRSAWDKRPVARALRLSEYVDDRLDILLDMMGTVPVLWHARTPEAWSMWELAWSAP
jgi:hypothetical protein